MSPGKTRGQAYTRDDLDLAKTGAVTVIDSRFSKRHLQHPPREPRRFHHFDQLQPRVRLPQQRPPVLHRALPRVEQRQHLHVHRAQHLLRRQRQVAPPRAACRLPSLLLLCSSAHYSTADGSLAPDFGRPVRRHHALAEHDARPPAQRRHQAAQDARRVLVGPVVQHQLDEVDVGADDGLRLEEVVRLEGHAAPRGQVGGHKGAEGGLDGGLVLDDDLEPGERADERDGVVARGSADLWMLAAAGTTEKYEGTREA
ncbi:hypothetical protein VTK73DRAFT_2658 [Phialemonium thermophilum]|uniref:Uncharacterized protein n=1 Tax=Phialemonium thermophilum TaxID=223376 RepID=A0ABR3VQN5_9PEZI